MPCPSGLDCFAWQCKWKSARTCIRAVVQVTVEKPPLTVTRLVWVPPTKSSKKCKQLAAQNNDDTVRHEQHHVDDDLAVISEVEAKYRSRPVYGCGATQKEAEADLESKIKQLLRDVRREVSDEADKRTSDFHDTLPDNLTFDCTVCGE